MYSMPERFGTTSASLWTTTVSKPFGAISRAMAATSAEGHETRILGGMRFPRRAGKAKRAAISNETAGARKRPCSDVSCFTYTGRRRAYDKSCLFGGKRENCDEDDGSIDPAIRRNAVCR